MLSLVLETAYIFAETLLREFTYNSLDFGEKLVTLPAGFFWTKLRVDTNVVRLHSSLCELGHLHHFPIRLFRIDTSKEVVFAGRWLLSCLFACKTYRFTLCLVRLWTLTPESVKGFKERTVWLALIELSVEEASSGLLYLIVLTTWILERRFLRHTAWCTSLVSWMR